MRIRKLIAAAMSVFVLAAGLAVPETAQAAETTSTTYYENGYALTITQTVGSEVPDTVIEKMKYIYFNQYPKMIARLNPTRPRSVTFVYDPDYDGVAYTLGTTIVYSVDYMNNHPLDVDCATHELAHVVQGGYQNYGSSSIATALCEGVADYMRSIYGLYNSDSNWTMQEYQSSYSYTDSYGVTANFLTWVSLNKDSRIVYYINKTMHDGSYTDDLWVQLTGETVDELWADYAADANVYHMTFASNKEETFGITSGDTYVISSVSSSKALSVENDSSDNGANVCQRTYTEGNEAQQWVLNYVGDGLYTIINKASGKALDVNNAGSDNGTNIQVYNSNSSDAQKWAVVERGGNYTLFPVCGNGKGVLDLSSSSQNDGANIQLYEWNKTNAQRWEIKNIDGSDEEDYQLYAFDTIEAESFVTSNVGIAIDENSSRSGGANIGGVLGSGTWTFYHGVVFEENAVAIDITYCNPGSASYVKVYVDSMDNAPVGTVNIPNNSSDWTNYSTVKADLTTAISAGTHDIYLLFQNDSQSGYAQNCDCFKFYAESSTDAFSNIEAESYSEKSDGIVVDTNSSRSNGYNIGGVTNNSYVGFNNVKFNKTANSVSVCFAAQNGWASGQIEVYLDSLDGTKIASVPVEITGTYWDNYIIKTVNLTSPVSSGNHKVYLKFTNSSATAYVANVDYFVFSQDTVKDNEPVITDKLQVLGFQISQTNWGLRGVYSAEQTIDGKSVSEYGIVYTLKDYISSENELCIGSDNSNVYSHAATTSATFPIKISDSSTATDFAVTMVNNGSSKEALTAEYSVRVYAKLSDGSYVYSDVASYSIYKIASKLYDGAMMPNYNAHIGLYNNILTVVDSSYKQVDYDFNNIFVNFD